VIVEIERAAIPGDPTSGFLREWVEMPTADFQRLEKEAASLSGLDRWNLVDYVAQSYLRVARKMGGRAEGMLFASGQDEE
jgi:hypothetical protein